MRANNPPFKPFETKEERESLIKSLILGSLDESTEGRVDAIALLARSPSSPVVSALLALSDELAERRVGASIVLAGGILAAEDETWSLSFSGKFVHEIRLTANPRVLDGHEQLIIGDRSVWFGDCMRRDPDKRDAYSAFHRDDPIVARRSRFTFARLWLGAQSIYRNAAVSAVVVTSAAGGDAPVVTEVAMMPEEAFRDGLGQHGPGTGSIVETLAAWQPSTRH
jgi:hypothetical protein